MADARVANWPKVVELAGKRPNRHLLSGQVRPGGMEIVRRQAVVVAGKVKEKKPYRDLGGGK